MAQLRSTLAKSNSPVFGRVGSLLGVEPGEGQRVGALTALYALLIMGVVFIQTIAFALFIGEFGPQSLPYSYIASATLASLAAFVFLKLGGRASFQSVLMLNIAFLIVGCAMFWVVLTSPAAHWAIFFLPTWFQIQVNLVNLAIWPLAGRLFDVRQARRLLGLVGAGNWLANIVGGFVIGPLVAWLGTSQMPLLAATMTIAGLWLLWAILRAELPVAAAPRAAASGRAAQPRAAAAPRAGARGDQPLRAYVRLLLAYVFLWWMGFFFVDNIFYNRAAIQFPEAGQLTQAIGLLISATGVVALLTTIFGTSFVLRRYGLRATFLAMPAAVGAAMAALALAGSLGQTGALLFWLAAFGKLITLAWGFSFSQSALVLSYQPLPDDRRGQIQTLAEGIVQPFAVGVAGLALLGLNRLLGWQAVELSWFFVGITALLFVIIAMISRQYPRVLSSALARRQWGGTAAEPLDQAGLDLLRQALRSPHPAAVIYGLDMLERADPASIAQFVPELLSHPAPEVRRAGFERIETLRLRTAAPAVRGALAGERAPEVRAAALRALAALAEPHQLAPVVAALGEADQHARQGALVGLLRYAADEDRRLAEATLRRLAASAATADRILAARALAEAGPAHASDLALTLLHDAQIAVRREAIKAAAKARDPGLWPALVEISAAYGTSRLAVWALAAGGEAALPAIEAALARPDLARGQLIALANACARIRSAALIPQLAGKLEHADAEARTALLEALSAAGYRAANPDVVRAQIRAEAAQAAWIAATLADIDDAEATRLLKAALEKALHGVRDRLCLWLSFVYDAPAILRARATLANGPGAQYAYAIEILDSQLPADLKNLVLPIAEELAPSERLARLARSFPQARQTSVGRLQAIIAGPEASWFSAWTRACALFAAGSLPARECLPAARAAITDDAALVREAASWAVARLDPPASEGEDRMLSTLEKVIILKTVDVFGHTPDDVLADVAALLEEVEVAADHTIFRKGDPGDSLYVIVDGRMRVDDGDRLLNYLDEHVVFGEMALLDAEPRAASVTAVEPSRLLRLDQALFYELIADRPEIAIGLIRVLTGHLRARVRDVGALNAQVNELMASAAHGER